MTTSSAIVPVGYKQTEVGVIPEDWGKIEINEVGSVQTGPFGAQLHASDYVAWGTPLILIRNMKNGQLSDDGIPYVSDEDASRLSRYRVRAGDLIFSRVGRVGSCVIILPNQEGWLFSGQTLRIRFDTSKVNPQYAAYYFGKDESQQYILKETLGTTRASINTTILSSTPIILPPKGEQDAIAVSISNVDMIIGSIENLITKKRDIKQGSMQELLTGKTRLPGFTENWVVKQVSNFGTIVTGSTPLTHKPEFWGGNIPWITPTDITNKNEISTSERLLTIEGLDSIRILPENSVLVTCIASIGKNVILRTRGSCNQQINAIIPNEKHSTEFLYFLFENNKNFMLGNAGVTATMIISKTGFERFKFLIPNSLVEQEAIAEVLSDMDAEIAALEKRLEKAKAIKQGMIQELLTGKIRLVEPQTSQEVSA